MIMIMITHLELIVNFGADVHINHRAADHHDRRWFLLLLLLLLVMIDEPI